ncbi:hypothetical protein H2O64_17950 [Kordia sp. YSTF-M3]|uniref:Gingipain domain-containing protein n=1 Tax=Kordia aestuariivivens TaxID=2759037 RepID=A0ABR7QDE2_9FLAO|nr:hypothetical protein [Kordia aestuariivivens]MBC8756560.1 hypothetical protein [Kordia aestuariivivens]
MAFYFFTEPSKLSVQTQNKAFGAIDEDNYRLNNLFSGSSAPKAFAITDGTVLVQQIGATNVYNIVLKPNAQPDLNLPKIDYIIYKGIKKDSIIEGAKVANINKNDLTRSIHESAIAWYAAADETMPATEPAADTSLGLVYNASQTDPVLKKEDTDSLNEAFYAAGDITLPFIFGGNYIGDFDTASDFGITIVFEKIGFQPTFKLARELDSKLSFTALAPTATDTEKYKRKHEKEDALAFMDSNAFFNAFYDEGLQVFNGTGFVPKVGDAIYNDITTKHFYKNRIYIDIRNEFNDSFNYYNNYNDTIQWNLDNTNTLVDVNYYRDFKWPLLVISDDSAASEFGTANTDKNILFSFPTGDNEFPRLYYKRAFLEEVGLTLPEAKDLFFTPTIVDEKVTSKKITVPKSGGRAFTNYFKIGFLKSNETLQDQGLSLEKKTYLDTIFPLFTMDIPFDESSGKSYLKVYYDAAYVDKTQINGANYTTNLGIAKDNLFITFVSYPSKYNLNIKQSIDDKLPLSGMEGAINNLFLYDLDAQIGSIKIIKQKFIIGGVDKEYLKFQVQENDLIQEAEKYTFEDVSIMGMTVQQYQDLEQLKQTEFDPAFKTYLAIDDVITGLDDNGNPYTQFKYVLRGLKVNGAGDLEAHQAAPATDIIVFTDEKIESVAYERNYEEAIGTEIFSGTIKNEDQFIALQSEIQTVASSFETSLNNLDVQSSLLYSQITSLVSQKSRELWEKAVQYVQANPTDADDRPLYWARLKMASILKAHPYFLGDIREDSQIAPDSDLEKTITLMEEESRNYTKVDFSGAPAGAKKILVTGFDPFLLDESNPAYSGNKRQSNPSGCVALSLHGTMTANNLGYIQTLIVPVRYKDFDSNANSTEGQGEGVIEEYIQPFINQVDMIITVSQSGPGNYNIDRYATVTRGGFNDNLDYTRQALSRSIEINSTNLEWIETTLPPEFIDPPIVYDYSYVDSTGAFHSNSNGIDPPTVGERMNEGPGSDYLSNEIFYRVAKMREELRPTLPTGHFHISKIQIGTADFNGGNTKTLVDIVTEGINNAATGL